jgi:hypothetical protein
MNVTWYQRPATKVSREKDTQADLGGHCNEFAIKDAIDFRAVMNATWYQRPATKVSREKDTQAEVRIGINPVADKLTRLAKVSALFEAGAVFLPESAPWLSGLKADLLGVPMSDMTIGSKRSPKRHSGNAVRTTSHSLRS